MHVSNLQNTAKQICNVYLKVISHYEWCAPITIEKINGLINITKNSLQ